MCIFQIMIIKAHSNIVNFEDSLYFNYLMHLMNV